LNREARAVAALSHPNVVAVFDVGTHDGVPYLVSELLEGETLRERLKSGPILLRVVEFSLQIAEGLAAAHEKGVVHRDLKPENVFLTSGSRVKLIDFGLAKLDRADASAIATATLSAQMNTAEGVVMGTASYMSPEQVRGQIVDYRSDIFSFGAVLFEMLTGTRAFSGESSVETMNAILKDDPPEIDLTRTKASPGLERVLRHCLEKKPADRFQSARDLAFALSATSGSQATSAVHATTPTNRARIAWIALPMLLALLATVVGNAREAESIAGTNGIHDRYEGRDRESRHLSRRSHVGLRRSRRGIGRQHSENSASRLRSGNASVRYGRRDLPILVSRRCLPGILCRRQTQEDRHLWWSSPGSGLFLL
jgi:eukaryotic-like serine/threonine-protein kinase